jgi:ribose-phosphate pyrophosphokinase
MSTQQRLFSGNANPSLAKGISDFLGVPLINADVRNFRDGEVFVQINENVRGADVFVIQPTCPPVNDNLMELLIMIDALKRASAKGITAVMPYYGYARQDRKVQPRVPITAKLVADLLTISGAARILTVDLHVGQIQGFFNIPVDNLFATPVIYEYIKSKELPDIVIVAPDSGGVERARAFAKCLNASLAIIDKRRPEPGVAKVMHIIGKVRGKTAIIVDDIIDSAGTMCQAANSVMEEGARAVYACCTHPVFSPPALENIENSAFTEVVVTDTIPLREDVTTCSKIKLLSVAGLLGEAIRRICEGSSVSSLFNIKTF